MKNLFYIAIFAAFIYMFISAQKDSAPTPRSAESKAVKSPELTPEQISAKERAETERAIQSSVKRYLRQTLKDPDSLKHLQFTDLQTSKDGFHMLQFSFRAKNSFGAYGLEAMQAVLNTNSNSVIIGKIE